jgi:hypothetical protein
MRDQSPGGGRVPGAQSARDRRRHPAAHRASGSHLQQHEEREDQREAGERPGAEAADEVRIADRNQRLECDQQHARRRQARERRHNRRGEQPFGARIHGGRRVHGARHCMIARLPAGG